MIVPVVMVVTMVTVIVMVIVAMVMMFFGAGLGAFRLEWRLDQRQLRTEFLHRGLELRIAAQAKPVFPHLDRDVAVAEVPGQSRERDGIVDAHFEQRLRFRDDLNQITVVEQKRVVGAQTHRFRKIQFDAGAFDTEDKTALRQALRIGKDQRVGNGRLRMRLRTFGGGDQFAGKRHPIVAIN